MLLCIVKSAERLFTVKQTDQYIRLLVLFLAAPVGVVSNFTTIRVNTTSVTLGWINVPCRQRGGQLTNFEVILKILNTTSVLKRLNSNVNSITISGLNATTYYTVSVRYINLAGAGNFSPDYVFRTLDNGVYLIIVFLTSYT